MPSDREDGHAIDIAASELRQKQCGLCSGYALAFNVLALDDSGASLIGEVSGCPACGTGVFADDDI